MTSQAIGRRLFLARVWRIPSVALHFATWVVADIEDEPRGAVELAQGASECSDKFLGIGRLEGVETNVAVGASSVLILAAWKLGTLSGVSSGQTSSPFLRHSHPLLHSRSAQTREHQSLVQAVVERWGSARTRRSGGSSSYGSFTPAPFLGIRLWTATMSVANRPHASLKSQKDGALALMSPPPSTADAAHWGRTSM